MCGRIGARPTSPHHATSRALSGASPCPVAVGDEGHVDGDRRATEVDVPAAHPSRMRRIAIGAFGKYAVILFKRGCGMAKYLVKASYTVEGTKGLIKGGGGTARRAALQQTMQGVGGRLEAFYYALGDDDVYGIVDAPDNVTAAAISLTINAAGGASVKTVALLTPEEIDQAAKKTVNYRAPGS